MQAVAASQYLGGAQGVHDCHLYTNKRANKSTQTQTQVVLSGSHSPSQSSFSREGSALSPSPSDGPELFSQGTADTKVRMSVFFHAFVAFLKGLRLPV